MRNPEGQGGLNTQPWPWRRPLPWDLVVPRLLRAVLQVSPPVSNGQCRSAECEWPTGPRSGKPCHRIHRAGALAPQSGRPWDGTASLIPNQDLLKTGQRAGEREKRMKQKVRAERKGQVYWVHSIKFVWGGALAPWAARTGLGRSGV